MSFLQKVEKLEKENKNRKVQHIKDNSTDIEREIFSLGKKIEDLLLQAYYNKITEEQFIKLHEELMDSLYSYSKPLFEIEKSMSALGQREEYRKIYSCVDNEYRRLNKILMDSYGSIYKGQLVCEKLIEQEKQKGNNLLKRISRTITEWTVLTQSEIADLKSTQIEETTGLLGEINYQNNKVDVTNQAGRIYYDLSHMRQEIFEYIEEGYFKENMDNVVRHIDAVLEDIEKVITTLPLHANYTEEYFRNDVEQILLELENNEKNSNSRSYLKSWDKKDLMKQYAERMILKFALAQALIIQEGHPKSLKEEMEIQLKARLHGAYEVTHDLETNPIKNLLSPAEFSDLISAWRFVKSSSLRALDCLRDNKKYINYIPYQCDEQDVLFGDISEKIYISSF